MREGPSGNLIFTRDGKALDKVDRKLRIRVMTMDQVTSSFCEQRDYSNKGLSDVEVELCKARDALLDEELYHEVLSFYSRR